MAVAGEEEASTGHPAAWTDWMPLPGSSYRPTPAVLAELLDGGQAFRWRRLIPPATGEEIWEGIWDQFLVRLRIAHTGELQFCHPRSAAGGTGTALAQYLGLDFPWHEWVDELPWRSDPHLRQCLAAYPGLRILSQPLGETLLMFLCSATKQIVQIQRMAENLASRFGRPVPGGRNALPDWRTLAEVGEQALRTCQLGFRARHISSTAHFLATHQGWLDEISIQPYAEAKASLMSLPGVGAKVADCVLLFGAGYHEAFPADVWILRAMARHYGLQGWTIPQTVHFAQVHYGPRAGIAQQYLFAWERRCVRRTGKPSRYQDLRP